MLTGKVPLDFNELYPRLYPIIAFSARGSLSRLWIHKQYGAFKVVAKYYYPENPRTGLQQGNRSVFYDAVKNWQGFDIPTRQYYNAIKYPGVMSGYNHYIRKYLRALFPMIIYWEPLKQSESENVSIPEYIVSPYFRANFKESAIVLDIDGGGEAITTGVKADLRIPFNCVVKNWTLLSDVTSSLAVDVWKDTFANFPPTDADSICAGSEPYTYLATKGQNLAATGFNPYIQAGYILRFNVDSNVAATRAHLELGVEKD